MNEYPSTIVIRHRKENLKKCSLTGLESRFDFNFFRYPLDKSLPYLEDYILLSVDAEDELLQKDYARGLLIIDSTWHYATKMAGMITMGQNLIIKRLPQNILTAYPRRQNGCAHPSQGLASIEAIYSAYLILGRPVQGLLDHYYWKEEFANKNSAIFEGFNNGGVDAQ